MIIIRKNIEKAFSLVELMVAVGLLAAVLAGSSVIFKVAIESHRQAGATAELMRNLRAVTEQLNTDFGGLEKGACLVIASEVVDGKTRPDSASTISIRYDKIYYFSSGQFQSLIEPNRISNTAIVSLNMRFSKFNCSKGILVRQAMLLLPAETTGGIDFFAKSLADYKVDITGFKQDITYMLNNSGVNLTDPNQNWKYFCGGVGYMKIEWTDGRKTTDNKIEWFGLGHNAGVANEQTLSDGSYRVFLWPYMDLNFWPKAIKFTFTLYDSKGILKEGKTFTHIVYLGE